MKLTIGQDEMMAGLQTVQNVVSSRTTLPILSNVLLKAEDDSLEMTATDLDVTVSSSVAASVETSGSITVPVKKLFGIARELDGRVELEVDEDHHCSMRSGGSFYKVNGIAAAEFPPLGDFSGQKTVTLPQEILKGMLKKTAYAVSNDETRYVLNGLFCSFKEHKLTMVATDGRRLALTDEEAEVPEESQGDLIIPTKAVNELHRLLQDKGTVEIQFNETQVLFSLKGDSAINATVISKQVEGAYPNYRQVIPGESKERVTFDRDELLHAVRRAEIMTSDKANSVKFNFSENQLTITSNSPDIGEGHENMAIKYNGESVSVAFNPQFFIEPLKALDEEEVHLEFTDQLSPGVIKVGSPFLYVIMPMRTS